MQRTLPNFLFLKPFDMIIRVAELIWSIASEYDNSLRVLNVFTLIMKSLCLISTTLPQYMQVPSFHGRSPTVFRMHPCLPFPTQVGFIQGRKRSPNFSNALPRLPFPRWLFGPLLRYLRKWGVREEYDMMRGVEWRSECLVRSEEWGVEEWRSGVMSV